MDNRKFYLPIGYKYNGTNIIDIDIAETGGEAEKVYTKKPSQTNVYSWFAKVISVSSERIADKAVSEDFIKSKDEEIPEIVKQIPLIDAGTLLIQVQRECWEDKISEQEIKCRNCGTRLVAEVDLNKIEIPNSDNSEREPMEYYEVKLPRTYTISTDIEQLKEYDGLKFNYLRFRVATLGDAIKHEKVSKDEVLFWRNIAFDTLTGLFYKGDDGVVDEVPNRYISLRGKQLFTKDFNTKTLRDVRKGMQTTLPSAKYFYNEECPECGQETPFFASVGHFFMV